LRDAEHALVVEGAELLSMALEAGAPIESVYVAPEGRANASVAEVVERAYVTGARIFDLAPGVIDRISDTVAPQPVVAVVGFVPTGLLELRDASMVVVCVDVRDPGNAGTMIRTADAAGVDAVVCCNGTVDPTNPKTVRASAGSIFHTPVVVGGDPLTVIGTLRGWGMTTVGTEVRGGVDYSTFDWCRRVAVIFGNEASGLSASVTELLDAGVSIPMVGRAESLNVSVSTAVVCFEALRQRRARSGDPSFPDGGARRPTMPGMVGSSDSPGERAGRGTGDGAP
jgi:TrmH family RNA methyltransferase